MQLRSRRQRLTKSWTAAGNQRLNPGGDAGGPAAEIISDSKSSSHARIAYATTFWINKRRNASTR